MSAHVFAAPLPDPASPRSAEVAEFQGLYGTYHVSELLLQKIWLRGAFNHAPARTTSGERLVVVHPGSWNRLSGPDFRGARLILGEREITGDIEVHFHANAWVQHGHDSDPAYAGVVLHVVLFPPPPDAPAVHRSDGTPIATLALVDLLWHDLEEYATDEAVAALSSRDAMPLVEHLLSLDAVTRAAAVREAAATRWKEKLRYARVRIERCGWEQACHLTALEILGYRANRAAMLRVGTQFPWPVWTSAVPAPALEALLAAGAETWSTRGVRPANQPRLRLAQYLRWTEAVPDWPARLRDLALPALPTAPVEEPIAVLRRRAGFARWRDELVRTLTGDQLGGLRFDTFVINLVLPFLAATRPESEDAASAWWRLWTPGDIAEVLLQASRQLAAPGARETRTNEAIQGLLGLHLRRALATGA